MVDPKPNEIVQAEQLMNEGKTEEALKIVRVLQQKAWNYSYTNPDIALEIASQNNDFIEKIGNEIDKAYNYLLFGNIYTFKGIIDRGLDFAQRSLKIFKKKNHRVGLASSFLLLGRVQFLNFDFKNAIQHFEQSLSIKEITPGDRISNLLLLANIYGMRGELVQALEYCEEGLKLTKEGKIYFFCPFFLYLIGGFHFYMDNYDIAKDYFERNLEVLKKFKNIQINGLNLFILIIISLDEKNQQKTNEYLEQLNELQTQRDNKFIAHVYSVAKGMVLIESGRMRDRAEAETLLKHVVDADLSSIQNDANAIQFMLLRDVFALYHLCNLYLEELGMSNNLKIIDDINPLILRLFEYAEKTQSKLLFTYVKVLQGKLELIQMNFDNAKIILKEAQELAELENNQFLAQRISNEHDRLLEQQKLWEKLKDANAPMSERIKLASFDSILERIQGKHFEEPLEIVNEQPILLLILAEGGILLFSYLFTDEWKHDTEIFSSFLSAFTSFSDEFFSKGLDRVKFGDDTLLIQSTGSFSVGYLYKGQSYPAKQKLTKFLEGIQDTASIWQALDKYYKTSQIAEVKDLPQIEDLIKDIFIN
ncbi:MAG: hypothetical protein ACFFFT_14065 [Candidatus Thorarchaeota archaeon]